MELRNAGKKCSHNDFRIEPHPKVEQGRAYCNVPGCGGSWWPPKEGNEKKRPAGHKELVKKYSRGFCENCLRKESELPGPEVLEAHHVIPYEHGGSSERENVWILCTCCHRLTEWMRTYMKHYGGVMNFTKEYPPEDQQGLAQDQTGLFGI